MKFKVFLVLVLGFSASLCMGQETIEQEKAVKAWSDDIFTKLVPLKAGDELIKGQGNRGWGAAFFEDINGDGKKDLLRSGLMEGKGGGHLYLYLNHGKAGDPNFIKPTKVLAQGETILIHHW